MRASPAEQQSEEIKTEFQTAEQMYTSGNVNLNVHEHAFLCFSMFPVSNRITSTASVAVPIFYEIEIKHTPIIYLVKKSIRHFPQIDNEKKGKRKEKKKKSGLIFARQIHQY